MGCRYLIPEGLFLLCDIDRNLFQRAGAVERHHRVEVLHTRGLQFFHIARHARRFKLEHVSRLAIAQALERLAVIQGNIAQGSMRLPVDLLDIVQGFGNHREVRQPQEYPS